MGGAGHAGRTADAGQSWPAAVRQEGRGSAAHQPLGAAVLPLTHEPAGEEGEESEGGRGERETGIHCTGTNTCTLW